MPKLKGIKRRWMMNNVLVVICIVLLGVAAFSVAMASYYYSSMASGLEAKALMATEFLNYSNESEFLSNATNYVSSFEEKNSLELQFLSRAGSIRLSSYGLTAGTSPGTPDISNAIASGTTSTWTGNSPDTGEHVMAVSAPIKYNDSVVGVVRFVTSLKEVDRQIMLIVFMAIVVGLIVAALIYFSSVYFVRSIVDPIRNVTETATRIAAGSYGIQMDKKYDDEIGDLTDAINDMSARINQSEKMKSEFISSVSHELRTPLTAINGWAETISSGEVHDPTEAQKGMAIIVSEARRLTNMVEELLEFSRIEDGRFTLSIEPIDIKAELEDAVYTYREFFRREGITLCYQDDGEEFPAINGDPERLRQVFCNLLDNAAKHGGSGKRIDAAIERREDMAVITIDRKSVV